MIRKAEFPDLTRILEIYAEARQFMRETGNPNQWGNTNPREATLREDIELGQLFAVERNGEICGVFAFLLGEDETYKVIYDGAWRSDEPYGTIHRIASKREAKGVFTEAFEYCRGVIHHLRIDTHHDNKVMQHVVTKHGFERRGIIHLADGAPRIAYEIE